MEITSSEDVGEMEAAGFVSLTRYLQWPTGGGGSAFTAHFSQTFSAVLNGQYQVGDHPELCSKLD